jgi:hypothetical protein
LAGNLIPMADSWISMTLLLGIQFTQVQRYWESTLQMAFSPTKLYCIHEANTGFALPNAWRRSVRALS